MSNDKGKKKRKKKKSKFGYYLYAVVVLVLMVAIILVSALLLTHVQRISIDGTKNSRKNDILRWVQEDPSTVNSVYAWWKFNYGSYKLPPYLKEIDVGFAAPWALKIKVKEKEPIGYVATDTDYVSFDEEGLVVVKGFEAPKDLPMIEGLEVHDTELYKKIQVKDKKIFSYIVNLTEDLKKQKLKPDHIIWEENGMSIYFQEVQVKLGRTNFEQKIIQLPPILEKLEGKKGVLDLEYYQEVTSKISFCEESE